jgi:hypothetical protein
MDIGCALTEMRVVVVGADLGVVSGWLYTY